MEQDVAPVQATLPTVEASTPPKAGDQLARQLAAAQSPGDGGIFAQLSSNPFFTAGFGLVGLGAVLALGQRSLKTVAALARRRMLVDVEITGRDESFQWFLHWMSNYQRTQLNTKVQERGIVSSILRKLTPGLHHLSMQTTKQTLPNGAYQTRFSLVPGQGRHILRYRNAFIAVNRNREKTMDITTGIPFETVTLTTLYAHRHVFESLFQEAHALVLGMQEGKTIIHTSWGTEWKPFGQPKRKRPLDSIVLEKGVKEHIVADVRAFLNARNWYLDRGIPYRRGYLLYGPPGTGKSSFIQALAGELDFNIAMLNLSERGLTDDRLNYLLSNVPPRCLVLLEDADAAFSNRSQSDEHGYRGATVTFSGLLNALDGVASAEERIIILTTNHVERLDPALVRPGRVDMTVRLGEASAWQIEQYWDRFYAEHDQSGVQKRKFIQKLDSLDLLGQVSTAALQGLFLDNKDDPEGAIQNVSALAPRETGQPSISRQSG